MDNLKNELGMFTGTHPGTTDSTTTALRLDDGKLRMDLVPVEVIVELARVYTAGTVKYEGDNWRKGMKWSRCVAALYRHLTKWQAGMTFDTETQCHHLAHVAWNALTLMIYQMEGLGTDDRQGSRYREDNWVSYKKD